MKITKKVQRRIAVGVLLTIGIIACYQWYISADEVGKIVGQWQQASYSENKSDAVIQKNSLFMRLANNRIDKKIKFSMDKWLTRNCHINIIDNQTGLTVAQVIYNEKYGILHIRVQKDLTSTNSWDKWNNSPFFDSYAMERYNGSEDLRQKSSTEDILANISEDDTRRLGAIYDKMHSMKMSDNFIAITIRGNLDRGMSI